jgi:hypothetical protein
MEHAQTQKNPYYHASSRADSRGSAQTGPHNPRKVATRNDSKTLLQKLREQMKKSEANSSSSNDLNRSRLGALDLQVGLKANRNRPSKQKSRIRRRKRAKPLQWSKGVSRNASPSEFVDKVFGADEVEEDEELTSQMQRNQLEEDSIAEEIEEDLNLNELVGHQKTVQKKGSSQGENKGLAPRPMAAEQIETSPWKLTTEHVPSKLFDSLDLSMSMRQSIPIDLRRPETPNSEEDDDEEETSDVEKNSINIEVAIRTAVDSVPSQPSANAITPSKVLTARETEENTAMFETPKVKRVGRGIMNIVQNDHICTSPPVEKFSRAFDSPKYQDIQKVTPRKTPKSSRGLIHPVSTRKRQVYSNSTTLSNKPAAPWGRGNISDKKKNRIKVAERRKLYMQTLKKRAKHEQLERRNGLKRRDERAASTPKHETTVHSNYQGPSRYQSTATNHNVMGGGSEFTLGGNDLLTDHVNYFEHRPTGYVRTGGVKKGKPTNHVQKPNPVNRGQIVCTPSDESLEEERIKASIERLETRLQSRQIMYSRSSSTLRRGGSAVIQNQRSEHSLRRLASAPTYTQQGRYEQAVCYNPPNVPNYADDGGHYPTYGQTNHYHQSAHQQAGARTHHHQQYTVNSEFEQSTGRSSYYSVTPPKSPGPPPPPPSNFQGGMRGNHAQQAPASSVFERQTKQPLKSPKKMGNYQACHIMQKNVSYAYLRHKEKKARQQARLRKVKTPALGSSPLLETPSLVKRERVKSAGTHGKTNPVENENVPPVEKDAAVLVNRNNLHLLLSPGGR